MAVVAMVAAAAVLFMSAPGELLPSVLVIGPESVDRHPRRLSPGSASPFGNDAISLPGILIFPYYCLAVLSLSESGVLGRPRSESNLEGPASTQDFIVSFESSCITLADCASFPDLATVSAWKDAGISPYKFGLRVDFDCIHSIAMHCLFTVYMQAACHMGFTYLCLALRPALDAFLSCSIRADRIHSCIRGTVC